jgi:hypothetical protein
VKCRFGIDSIAAVYSGTSAGATRTVQGRTDQPGWGHRGTQKRKGIGGALMPELSREFVPPLSPKNLGAHDENVGYGPRAINSVAISPALMVLPKPTSSASGVTGRRRHHFL